MSRYFVSDTAGARIDDIYRYTRNTWGDAQAKIYVTGLFECFELVTIRQKPWRVIPAEYGVSGFFVSYERHFVFFRKGNDGAVSILSVLGQNMDIGARLSSDT